MAIEVLKRERAKLRWKARQCNSRHWHDGHWDGVISVRTMNMLRLCAKLTAAIVLLKNGGVA